MFAFAHSLGYPHPGPMLDSMTAEEYRELLAYIVLQSDARREAETRAREADLRSWFDRKHAQQERRKANG